jgi:hypothetical protein
MTSRIAIGLIVFVIMSPSSFATPGDPPEPSPAPVDDLCAHPTGFKRFACDSRALGRTLTLRDPRDRYRALGVLAGAGVLFAERRDIQEYSMDHRSASRTRVYDRARNLGKGGAAPLFAGALYLTGKISGDSYHTESAQILLESMLYGGLLALTGQVVIASDRPEDGTAVRTLHSNGHGVSGDVALAAAAVAPLDRRYLRIKPNDGRGRKFLKVTGRSLLYTALALTAVQRVDADKHWAPDVFLGAAAGLTAGYSICSAHEPPPNDALRDRAAGSFRPTLVPISGGLALSWSF